MRSLINRKSIDRSLPLLFIFASVGLIAYILITSFAPFKDNIFKYLFNKSQSHAAATDWNQVGKDPQHTGHSSENLGNNIQIKWEHVFDPEKVNPQVQVITYGGKVFVPTGVGNVYAFDATTGEQKWKFNTNSPIMASVAADSGLVFAATLTGEVYGIDTDNGSQRWKTRLAWRKGFTAPPIIAEGKVFIGGQDGNFYALDQGSGTLLWKTPIDSPILMAAAWNNPAGVGRVYFGASDMRVYALNSSNGSSAWTSPPKVEGTTFKDYYPVVTDGKVVIRPQPKVTNGFNQTPDTPSAGLPVSNYDDSTQNAVLADYDAHPTHYSKSLYVFNETTGQELPGVIHFTYLATMNGATFPGCVDKDGLLLTTSQLPDKYPDNWRAGWARLNLNTRKIVDGILDPNGTPIASMGWGNIDENFNVSCAANGIVMMHTSAEELTNPTYMGFFNQQSKIWATIPGHLSSQIPYAAELYSVPVISNGLIFHVSSNQISVKSTN